MISVERQVHGYRQGHQLLAASAPLPKGDQSLIDRLSDVAGPLRPKERFEPYLTAYPLPSGERYVLARTWQDTQVARAGCVRTLSLVVPVHDWAMAANPAALTALLEIPGELPTEADARAGQVAGDGAPSLPPTREFRANELLEALFLEETRPVVVFDAPTPDLIALRLLTALWPSLRRRFALSTFALSPRKLSGRDFNLVFAPKTARAKFADWPGRRVDGRSTQEGRHKWTSQIVSRVFEQPDPQLLSAAELDLIGDDQSDGDSAAALRISLLWEELSGKLATTPTAALGLLDIANSGRVQDRAALSVLERPLTRAIEQAAETLPSAEAWDFLSAMIRKLQGRPMPSGRRALSATTEVLAGRAPAGGVALLAQTEPDSATRDLVPSIAAGIAAADHGLAVRALTSAPPQVLGRLIAESPALAACVAGDETLVGVAAQALPALDAPLMAAVSRNLLPSLTEDWQIVLAEPLIERLDGTQLADEVTRLGLANDFAGQDLAGLLIEQARRLDMRELARAALVGLPQSIRRDGLIANTLDPVVGDVAWLLDWAREAPQTASQLLLPLLRRADDRQLPTLLADPQVGQRVITQLGAGATDVLMRAIASPLIPLGPFVQCVEQALPALNAQDVARTVELALNRCLPERLDRSAAGMIARWLGILGSELNGRWVVRTGLRREVSGEVASRNMIAFQAAPEGARGRIIAAVDEMADALHDRRAFDLDAAGIEATVKLMTDAERSNPTGLLRAAGRLLPALMRQTRLPISPLIALLFPAVYRELAKEDDLPNVFKMVSFFDWDRCKAARHELVDAFLSSSWPASDLALTACRCNEVTRILRRTAKSSGGESYIDRIGAELNRLPAACRQATGEAMSALRTDWPVKYDWRD